jgi:hypothetical protein
MSHRYTHVGKEALAKATKSLLPRRRWNVSNQSSDEDAVVELDIDIDSLKARKSHH